MFRGGVDGFKRKGWPKFMSKHLLCFRARTRGRFSCGTVPFWVGKAAWELLPFLSMRAEQSLKCKVKLGELGALAIKQARLLLILLHSSRDPELPQTRCSPRSPGWSISPPSTLMGQALSWGTVSPGTGLSSWAGTPRSLPGTLSRGSNSFTLVAEPTSSAQRSCSSNCCWGSIPPNCFY